MPNMPTNARSLTGFGKYGVDDRGEKVFFSFEMSRDRHATFLASHRGLANTIHYLQQIARQAEERRIARSSRQSAVQMLKRPPQVIRKGSIMPDVTGRLARLEATTPSGAPLEIQIEFDALVSLQERLPDLIEKMRGLQEHRKAAPAKPLAEDPTKTITMPPRRGKEGR